MATITVNGVRHVLEVEPDTPLLWVLREQLGLTGTKYGCGVGTCGSCTVHINGAAVRACSLTVDGVHEDEVITTIEGLSDDLSHPIQQAWAELDVPQCGYCQSGQIMSAAAFIVEYPEPSDEDITLNFTNLCRCGTYNRIRAGIKRAADLA